MISKKLIEIGASPDLAELSDALLALGKLSWIDDFHTRSFDAGKASFEELYCGS